MVSLLFILGWTIQFNGYIDDVRIYNYTGPMTTREVSVTYVCTTVLSLLVKSSDSILIDEVQ